MRKTAFSTHNSLYEFRVLPFGLKSAPFSFQRHMDKILAGLQHICLCYLDDCIIFSDTFEDHLKHLELVFSRIRQAKMYCKPKKCFFGRNQIKFLGFIVSDRGVSVDPSKVEAIKKLAVPNTKKQLQSFLGLCGFYRRFVFNYAKICTPLHNLVKDVPYVWTKKQTEAFETLKKRLVSAPILGFPDFKKPFKLSTDGSDHSVGAVLSQARDGGGDTVIAYVSHKLTDNERKWTVREKEAFAVVWACNQLRFYLLGGKTFIIETDHANIANVKWVLNYDKGGRLGRWAILLGECQFKMVAIPGKSNVVADALSRLDTVLNIDSRRLPNSKEFLSAQEMDP